MGDGVFVSANHRDQHVCLSSYLGQHAFQLCAPRAGLKLRQLPGFLFVEFSALGTAYFVIHDQRSTHSVAFHRTKGIVLRIQNHERS
jgi:hypothetical protein